MSIYFEKATKAHVDTIFRWLEQDFISEFWDNTQAHKDDIINFIEGRKTQSKYADGKYVYWIASLSNKPFAMFMTIHETHKSNINREKLSMLSRTGNTYCIDYMIGNVNFFGKGYGAKALTEFIDYFRSNVDHKADTFLIDPSSDNERAKHVYMKAGFEHIADFVMQGDCSGAGKLHHLLIKKFEPIISITPATFDDYQLITKMGADYEYELALECGRITEQVNAKHPSSHLVRNFKTYFEDQARKAYLIKVYDEVAGFVLLNQFTEDKLSNWNMAEFFVIAKFRSHGIGRYVAYKVWEMNPGKWEVSVIPENKKAINFWEKTIKKFTRGVFDKSAKEVTYDKHQPKRVIFKFDTGGQG